MTIVSVGDGWECLLPLTGQWCPKIADLLLYYDSGSTGAASIRVVSQGRGGPEARLCGSNREDLTWRGVQRGLNHFLGFGSWFSNLTVHCIDKPLFIQSALARSSLLFILTCTAEKTHNHRFGLFLFFIFDLKSQAWKFVSMVFCDSSVFVLFKNKHRNKWENLLLYRYVFFIRQRWCLSIFCQSQEEDTQVKNEMICCVFLPVCSFS